MIKRAAMAWLVVVLVLGACAETSPPGGEERAAGATLATVVATVTPTARATQVQATPAASPTARAATSPAARPAPTAAAAAEAQSWPAFVREIDFRVPAGNSYGPRALAVHPGLRRIYARTYETKPEPTGLVTVLDAQSGEVLAVVQTGPDSYAEGQLALDTVHNRLYAVNQTDNTCSVLDAESLEPLALLDGVDRVAVDETNNRLYLAGLARLRVLDATSHRLVREAPIGGSPRFALSALDVAGQRLYLVIGTYGDYALGIYDTESLAEVANVALPGRPDDLVADARRGVVYLTVQDSQNNLLWTLDKQGQKLAEEALGSVAQRTRLALDAAGDRLFLGREAWRQDAILVRDLKTGGETEIPLERAPSFLAWDEAGGQLLASHTYPHHIVAVDVERRQRTALMPTALNVTDLDTDPQRGYLFVTDSASQLHILDAGGEKELAVLPGEGRIAVDSSHGRLYTGGSEASRVRVVELLPPGGASPARQVGEIKMPGAVPVADEYHGRLLLVRNGIYLASLETLTITAAISDTLPQVPAYSPNPAAVDAVVDAGSGRILAVINNGVPGSNNGNYLYVYEPDTYRRILTDTERSTWFVEVEPDSGRAYVSRAHIASGSTSLLAEGQDYVARLESVFGALQVDATLGRLYLSLPGETRSQLLVLDAANLDVLGNVTVPGWFALAAADDVRHLLFLVSPDGRVQVWNATGGAPPSPVAPSRASLPIEQIWQFFMAPGGSPILAGDLYRSDDEGRTWQFVGEGLPDWGVWKVVVSPGFATDRTLFAVPSATDRGLGVWKSTDAGQSWRIASRGLSDLAVQDLAISPDFQRDGTLLAMARKQGLFRSTDGGDTWTRLTERYYRPVGYPETPGLLAVSPTYGRDQTLFVSHDGLKRSTDGGETWTAVTPLQPGSLALSPAYSQDQTLFGWFGEAGLLRSTDGGETWQPAVAGLVLKGYGSARLILAPDYAASQTVYLLWVPSAPDEPTQYFRSPDGGQSWEQATGGLPAAATDVQLGPAGKAFVGLDQQGRLARWPLAQMNWQPSRLPALEQIEIYRLALSPGYATDRTLFAYGEGVGVLRSQDGGLTWEDTGFPLRISYGEPPALAVLGPGQVLAGSALGLYRFEAGQGWSLAGGGLPQGVPVGSPVTAADGSLRVVVPAQEEGQGPRILISTDGGRRWREPVPQVPEPASADDLLFSPALASDGTAFFAPSWGTSYRTGGGGPWQPLDLPEGGYLAGLDMSPSFERDGLLFARMEDNSLWRSTDRGARWTRVQGAWGDGVPLGVAASGGYRLATVTFSPAYGQDGVLLLEANNEIYRSTDGGVTWRPVLSPGTLYLRASFSPDYARDGVIYIQQGDTIYRSADRGLTWQALPTAPWASTADVGLQLSPTFGQDTTLLAWGLPGLIYQSTDGGRSWRDIGAGLPAEGRGIRQVVFSANHARDRLLYLVPYDGGILKRVADGPWQLVTRALPPAQPTAPAATATPRPAPTPTPRPAACPTQPAQFLAAWQQTAGRLGCPQGEAERLSLAEQAFEQGRMIWDSGVRRIYVLLAGGPWQAFDDTWVEGQDMQWDPALPPPPRQPQRGFGKVWRESLGGPAAAIGWATEDERAVDGWKQRFAAGLLVWTDALQAGAQAAGSAYLLYDDGTWQVMATPRP